VTDIQAGGRLRLASATATSDIVAGVFHVLTLTYLQSIDVVDQTRPAHLDWIKDEVARGRLILTGRLESQTGGVLITGDISTEDAESLMANDPYQLAGLVRYDRVGFTGGARAPGL
jgi:uncharacterized protein YciI